MRKENKALFAMVASVTLLGLLLISSREAQATTVQAKDTQKQLRLENVEIYQTETLEDFNHLTKVLEDRKGKVIMEIVNGVVLDDEGNGKQIIEDIIEFNSYIKYDQHRFKKGDKVQSVFVYNPNNNATDDIIYRIDNLMD